MKEILPWLFVAFAAVLPVALGVWAALLARKYKLVKKALLWWLIPPYPIAFFLANLIPKDEACGYSGICYNAILAGTIGIGWFLLFPIVEIIYLSARRIKDRHTTRQVSTSN